MLTARLKNYAPEEVDLLIQALKPTIGAISNNANNCRGNGDCHSCKAKNACYDLTKLFDFLTLEAKYGYPHCSK